jgi:hypothetical protein
MLLAHDVGERARTVAAVQRGACGHGSSSVVVALEVSVAADGMARPGQ